MKDRNSNHPRKIIDRHPLPPYEERSLEPPSYDDPLFEVRPLPPPPGYDFSDIIKRIREQLDNYRRANNAYDVSCWDDTSKLGFKTVKFRCKNFNRYVAKYYPVVADSPEKIIAFLQFLGYRVASSEIYHIS